MRVLVVEGTGGARGALVRLVADGGELTVVATAGDGRDAALEARAHRPDVIAMDLDLPGAAAFAGIARVMAETPTPILALTGAPGAALAFRALALGALDILEKPGARADLAAYGALLRTRLRLLAGVEVARLPRPAAAAPARRARGGAARCELVVVGASLGGPRALAALLHALPPGFAAAVAVVQHIADGFTDGLAAWLAQESRLAVASAADGAALRAGRVLVAPSGRHLVVEEGRVRLSDAAPVEAFRPSVTPLFESAARAYGPRACGVLLTGTGRDGAAGLKALRDAGALTIAQDAATSVAYGMPGTAVELGAAARVLPLAAIAPALAAAAA